MNKFLGSIGLLAILILASCETTEVADEESLFEIATEGEEEKPDDKPEN
ncbi:Hypothetical protein I595_2529 [Croceitalea dokdonensis DOKDO 023]|uniref:Uncharacterized protein n=1 Tax=Croceitalea dokdonensis DOKDO 023 TaxID=1300341 RepID=A0A0P7ADG9_9FLAO|nr:hypothetical protein [Croceitalea dokdonensis]KPM31264.1 Hypothetical protein I595_2529 [Croceitalea dokdonensis DOKDO 023]